MMDHADVRVACKNTNDLAARSGVSRERLSLIREASDRSLREAIARANSEDLNSLAFLAATTIGPEELLARISIAALVLREREMSRRLNG